MQNVDEQRHIALSASQHGRSVAVAVGDPERATMVAAMCDEHKMLAFNREYKSFMCTHNGVEFLVVSHGVGAPGASICFEELIAIGVKHIIRAGTCGTLQPQRIKQGDFVLISAACADDGTTERLVPKGFPAVADIDVLQTLKDCVTEAGESPKVGYALCSDIYYEGGVKPSSLPMWAKAGAEVVEMESAALFVISKLRGIKAGCLAVVDGCPLEWEAGHIDMAVDKKKMLAVAISAAVKLGKKM